MMIIQQLQRWKWGRRLGFSYSYYSYYSVEPREFHGRAFWRRLTPVLVLEASLENSIYRLIFYDGFWATPDPAIEINKTGDVAWGFEQDVRVGFTKIHDEQNKMIVLRAVTVLRILPVSLTIRSRLGNPFGHVKRIFPLRIRRGRVTLTIYISTTLLYIEHPWLQNYTKHTKNLVLVAEGCNTTTFQGALNHSFLLV